MMPNKNISERHKSFDRSIWECDCGCDSRLELTIDKDDGEIWFSLKSYPSSLWQVLRWWWSNKILCHTELEMSKKDIIVMKDKLDEYLNDQK